MSTRILATVLLVTACAATAGAQPTISSTTGTFQRGAALTINGSGFGVKIPAAPYKYDGFDLGDPGTQILDWHTETNLPNQFPKYSTAVARVPGSQVAYQDFTGGNYNSTLGLTGLSVGQMYISGWYLRKVSGDSTRNFKFISFRGGPPGARDAPEGRTDMYAATATAGRMTPNGHMYTANCVENMVDNDYGLGGSLASPDYEPNGAWHRVESYMDIGDVGVANGNWSLWNDLQPWVTTTGVFREADCVYTNLYLSSYFASDAYDAVDGVPTAQWYWDELYVDITRARVEIGNAPVWRECTHREIQIPVAWSGSSVTVTANQGTFPAGATVYLFVVDAGGAMNATGFPVTIAGTGNAPPSVGITVPTGGDSWVTPLGTVGLAGTASDDAGISLVTWANDRGGKGSAVNVSGDWTAWSIAGVTLLEGLNTITVTAVDAGGLAGVDALAVTYDLGAPGQPGQPQR